MNLLAILITLISVSATAAQTTTTTTMATAVEANDDKFTITCDYSNRFPVCSNEGGRLDVLLNDNSSSVSDKSELYIKTVQTQPPAGNGHCDIGDRRSSSDNREVVVYTPGSSVKVADEIVCDYTVCIINTLDCDTAKILIRLQQEQLIQREQ